MKNNFQSNGKGRNQRVWQLLISMLIILTMGIGQMWGANIPVAYTYESSASKATMATNDYFSAASNPAVAGDGVLSANSSMLRCTVTKKKTATVTFTFTAKTAIEVASFTLNSYAGSDKIKSATIDYFKNSATPTNVAVTFDKSSASDKTITPASSIEMAANDVLTIVVNLSNTDTGNDRPWNINTITLNASITGQLAIDVDGGATKSMVLGAETPIETSVSNASGTETYQWYQTISTDTECASGTVISGAESDSYTPDEGSAGAYYYYCVVTDGLNTAKTELITVNLFAPLTGWVVFDGLVDDAKRASPVTYNLVSMTYETTSSSIVDVSSKTPTGTTRPYKKAIQLSKSTGGYFKFTIPTGYTGTFTYAVGGTGKRNIILATQSVTSATAEGGIVELQHQVPDNIIQWGEYTTPLAAGDYYICEGGSGNWQIAEFVVTLVASSCTKPGIPTKPALKTDATDYLTHNSAILDWDRGGATANSNGYKVYIVQKDNSSNVIADWVDCNNNSYQATGLTSSTTYTITVKAKGATGYCDLGDASESFDFTTNSAPSTSYTVTYMPGEGSGAEFIIDDDATVVAGCPSAFIAPSGKVFNGWKDALNNDVAVGATVTSDMELTAQWIAEATPCYTFTAPLPAEDVVYSINDIVAGSDAGGEIEVVGNTIKNTAYGLLFATSGSAEVRVTLGSLMKVGTVIRVTLWSNNNGSARTLKLNNAGGTTKDTWSFTPASVSGEEKVFTYTVEAGDGLVGTNTFNLKRGSDIYLKSMTVSNCGAELLELSSAVSVAGKATVTLNKSLIEAGGSATATYSAIDAAYDFDEWEITSGDATIADAKANPAVITMGSTDATITLKLKAAAVKHTVTYYDGATELGTELVNNGSNPTSAGIVAPHKLGYTFGGWSTTNGGAAVALNTISVAADMPLYAVYSEINCAALSGTIFSLAMDVAPAANCTIRSGSGYETEADLDQYAAISGGIAMAKNSSTSNHLIITTTPTVKFAGGNGKVHIQFDCALKEGDKIKTTISSQNIAYTTTDSRSTTNYFTKGTDQELTITKNHVLENSTEIYLWAASSNGGELVSLQVIRPVKYAVTFNMHDHGEAVDPQYIVEGGKVTEPATTDITGWDFGGWYKESTFENEWDFANDEVGTSAIELHAKWTAHVYSSDVALGTLSVNGEAITIVPSQTVYAVELPMGTSAIPTVAATAHDANAKACTVTQATAVDGSATVYIKAEDNTTEATYTINFSVATSKDIELVWDKTKKRCDDTTPDANVKSDDASVSAYINKITFTGGGAEGSSLNVGNTTGNMFTLSAKAGYAFQAMSFFGKIQDATCEYSLDGGAWTELASTKTDGDKCYANIFSAAEVHEFRLRSTGTSGVWIRNMQLTIVEACTPIVVAWDEEPVEFEVGKAGYAIAATANNSGAVTYSSTDGDVIAVNGSTGALTVSALGSVTLKAATAEGDGTAYCANGGNDIEISKAVNTYYLVTFDGQNGEAANEVKYYSGDAAIALPAAPSYSGFDFQGWFDAETGGNKYLAAITPTASMTVYAQWQAQCDGATITTQPTGASYLTGRTATALICEATAGNGGALTYEWFTCDDELKTNPVAATATPSTAVAGTYYYFCKVTEEGCAVEAFSNVVTITIADKDAICIIKSIPTSGTEATVDGVYQGNAYFKGRAADKKLNSQYDYVGVELASGYTFLATDKVVLNQTAALGTGDLSKFYVYVEEPAGGKTYVTVLNASPVQGDNWFAMPTENVGQSTLYVGRVDVNCNPSVGYLAVYRACAPILSKITVNSVEGTPDNTNHVTIEVPASTTQGQLEAIAYEWVSNSDAWTAAHDPAAANAWEFGVENTVTFTDKDGDASEYYITVNKAAASSDATLSALTVNGQAVALADGVYAYDIELPYGTTAVPTVVTTAHHAGAVATVDPCTLSGATITVVPESGVGDQQVYTLTFTVAAWEEIVIWDGSYMTAVATSPTAETELRWATTDFGSIGSYTTTCGEKSYSKYLPSGGASTGRYMTLTVPAGYVAKFYIVMATHSDTKERGMFIGSNLVKDPDETSVLELSNNDRDVAVAGMSEIVGAGTWYINPNNSIDFQEIRAYLRPGYARTVSNNIGTLCVDHNVAAADLFGATFYQIAGTEPQYGKIVFDEVFELEAGEPYIFQSTTGSILMFYGETVAPAPVAVKGMIGSYVSTTLSITEANKADIMYISSNKLWNCEDLVGIGLEVVANRCYIDYSQVPPVSSPYPAPGRRRIGISGAPQVATGNENIDASETPVKVMIDGQLYILRGEKMYDATGRLVK